MLIHSETSRLRSLLVNSGQLNFADADERLQQTSLALAADFDVLRTPAAQAALLTAVAIGVRSFGEVAVPAGLDVEVQTLLPIPGKTLAEQVRALGAVERTFKSGERTVVIGPSGYDNQHPGIRAVWNGWTAGVQPATHAVESGSSWCALAGATAGALGIAEAFLAEYGNVRAGRRAQRLSLWTPGIHPREDPDLQQFALPLAEWVIGLGNLGQAHLWCLALLPYPRPNELVLTLQDFDIVKRENWGTSLLVERGRYGMLKTELAERWCTARGFKVRRIDRRVDEYLRRQDEEPGLAMAGLDRMAPRRLLGKVGFDQIVDVGLGATAEDYQRFRVTLFDRSRSPSQHFAAVEDRATHADNERLPAYQSLISSRVIDKCGMTMLAGIPVAAPFVSFIASAVAVTQVIRLVSGAMPMTSLTGTVGSSETLRTTPGEAQCRLTLPIVRDVAWEPDNS